MTASAQAFAPANIALVKYWGKRQSLLNLPVTSSLSVSLPVGTHTKVSFATEHDRIILNGTRLSNESSFAKRLVTFCNLFRPPNCYFQIETRNEIPTGAGLASSSSGFAALTLAFNELLGWNLNKKALSILARQGSGSACRSLYTGFVQWHAGIQDDGQDSYAEPIDAVMNDLCLGIWMISEKEKPIDSRKAMIQTVETSPLYSAWPLVCAQDLVTMKKAIFANDFQMLGQVAEQNALTMHATMIASKPPILYWLAESVMAMQQIWQWRKEGLSLYFTMDAGPNLKLLFLKKDQEQILRLVPELQLFTLF